MNIDDFIWLPDVLEKLAVKHRDTQDEVEEVFFKRPRFRRLLGLQSKQPVAVGVMVMRIA